MVGKLARVLLDDLLNDVSLCISTLAPGDVSTPPPNKPPCLCNRHSPITFTLKVNETSTGTSDLFSPGLFLYSTWICSRQNTVFIIRESWREDTGFASLSKGQLLRTTVLPVNCFKKRGGLFHVLGVWEKIKTQWNSAQNRFPAVGWLSGQINSNSLLGTQTHDTEGIAFDCMYPFFSFYIQLLYLVGMEPKDRKMDLQ